MAQRSYPKTTRERAKLYLHCMVEIKERLGLVNGMLGAPLGPLFMNEFCSLQFRHICELIAIACLAAQGDFKTQRAFRESYSPQAIFNALRELYPSFFPQPTTRSYSNGQHTLVANKTPGAYKESDVTDLWARSGDDLHRASVDKYLKKSFAPPRPVDARKHIDGLLALLTSHVIPVQSSEEKVLLDVCLDDGEGDVVANFLTIDVEAGTMTAETYRGKLTGR